MSMPRPWQLTCMMRQMDIHDQTIPFAKVLNLSLFDALWFGQPSSVLRKLKGMPCL